MGVLKRKQTLLCKEGIGPALMVGVTKSHARSFLLLAQERSQPPPDEAVDHAEGFVMGVLEVPEPAADWGSDRQSLAEGCRLANGPSWPVCCP